MEIFRGQVGANVLDLTRNENSGQPFILTDENGAEYLFERVWYKPYKDATFCVLKRLNYKCDNGNNINFLFKIVKIDKEICLRYVTDAETCQTVMNDFFASHESLRGEKFHNKTVINRENTEELNNKSVNTSNYVATNREKDVGKKSVMITLIVIYSLLLVSGVLLAVVPPIQSVISSIGICNEISAGAYAISIGVMWIALTPSIGYYFATISPLNLNRKSKIIIAIITTVLLVAFVAVFFVIINMLEIDGIAIKLYYAMESDSDVWFIPLNMVFGALGIMVCYALTMFKINPEKIKDIDTRQEGEGFIHLIVHILALLAGLVFKIVKGILKFKEKHVNVFIIIATLLLTWLVFFTAFIFAIICIAIFVVVIVLYFARLVQLAEDCSGGSGGYLEIHDGGKTIKLERQPYVGEDRYELVYKDEYGGTWYSSDGGSTVYKKE